ncbi:hypothetical protein MN608_04845 [Microdochium nivale]|nr:hypothetical protein MN608_04845 [Microdochium nivale]
MFTRTVAAVVLSAVTLVSAQGNSTSPFTLVNVGAVDLGTRVGWCDAQKNSCTKFCTSLAVNDCSETTLKYECTCMNGQSPDLTGFRDTLPWNICTRNFQDCIKAGENNQAAQTLCKSNIGDKCPTRPLSEATPIDTATTSSSAPSSTSGTPASTSRPATPGNAADSIKLANGAIAVAVAAWAYMA